MTRTPATPRRRSLPIAAERSIGLTVALIASAASGQAVEGPDTVMRALVDELDRSMTLQIEDLEKPYFVQYAVTDGEGYSISATCGAIVSSDDYRMRLLDADVRVGYYDLDSTNFAGGGQRGFAGRRGRRGGARGASGVVPLPTEDDYLAIRQMAWMSTDGAYKAAAETLARKRAYMEDKSFPDRAEDFSREQPVEAIKPRVELSLDVGTWEAALREISARLLQHEHLLDHGVSLLAGASNDYLVNSEGTRLRTGETRAVLTVTASVQAEDGEEISDRIAYNAVTAAELPPVEQLLTDVDELATRLVAMSGAPILEDYTGPVLFEGTAAPQLFAAMLARGVAGRAEPVGAGRRRAARTESLEKYLGKRILPRSFQIHDDPGVADVGGTALAGHYAYDDEGIPARRVDVVVDGRLESMVMSRTPTRKLTGSSGHGRKAGIGDARATIGCLFVISDESLSDDDLRAALLEAAADQDLEYAIRVSSIGRVSQAGLLAQAQGGGGGASIGDPVAVYRVYPDGREELVRGCELGQIDVGDLKDIIAAGAEPTVYNRGMTGGAPTSLIGPAVVLEEIDLFTIEAERPKRPVLEAPHRRPVAGVESAESAVPLGG